MLNNLPNDILINIILFYPIKFINISKYIYNIIISNKNLIKKITKKYYYNFDLFKLLINRNDINEINHTIFKYTKIVSYFFYSNLSINEKKILIECLYIAPKRFYWIESYYKSLYNYINFYIIYYSLNEYDRMMDKLNIYVENNMIISTEISFNNHNIKYYLLYKNTYTLNYSLIIKPDNSLDYSINLLNEFLNKRHIIFR